MQKIKIMKRIITLFSLVVAISTASMAQSVISIDSARVNTTAGVPVDSGIRVQLTGIVIGPNAYPTPNGLSFYVSNHHAGVKVYAKKTYGYSVNDGDSVVVVGKLSQYGGQTELDPDRTVLGDTVYVVGSGTIDTPKVVTFFNESTEGQLIQINNVNMSAATGWTRPASGHGFTVNVGSYSLRIDSFTDQGALFNWPKPNGIWNIVGMGTQYKFAAPYNTGYQLSPRAISDFHLVTPATGINDVATDLLAAVVAPNPATSRITVSMTGERNETITTRLIDLTGREVLSQTDEITMGANDLVYNTATIGTGIYIPRCTYCY